jgi:putative transposase
MVADQVLEEAYHREEDGDVKERMLLVMRVRSDGVVASEVCEELRRTKGWASKWLNRFDEEGLEGLKTKERSGRPMKLDHREFVSVKRKVVKNECGWTVKEVREMIHEETDVTYSERHTYRLMAKWGVRDIVPDKRLLHKATIEERLAFKKRQLDFSGISQKASQSFPRTNPSSS